MTGKPRAKGKRPRGRKSPVAKAAISKRQDPSGGSRSKARRPGKTEGKPVRGRPASPARGPERPLERTSEGLRPEELEKKRLGELRALAEKMGMALMAVRKTEIIEEIIGEAAQAYTLTNRKKGTGKRMGPLTPVIEEAPEEKRGYGPDIVRELPDKDIVTAVAVEPGQLFAFWELTEKTAKKGAPAMRVQDVTKGGKRAGSHLEIRLPGRTGGLYIGVLPGRQYVVQAGVFGPGGRFLPARKSRKVSTPPALPSEEKAVLPRRYFRFHPVRYRG
jgi:hypothetical protein